MSALQDATKLSIPDKDYRLLGAMLYDAKIPHRLLAGMVGVHPITVWRWEREQRMIPTRVRRYLELAIRVRQLEQEVIRLQALLSDRSQAIDPIQD
jgi:DNA-binding Lrp family transcriptional regulator